MTSLGPHPDPKERPQAEPGISPEKLYEKLGFKPHSKGQGEYLYSDKRFNVPCCGRRYGKALSLDTPILTAFGWKTMAQMVPGDIVYDETGSPANVTGVSEIMYGRTCFIVQFNDGSEIVADAEHEWFTWDKEARKALKDTRRKRKPQLRTTSEIHKTICTATGESNHGIHVTQPLRFIERDLPIDPYTLGLWLGDGDSQGGAITCHDDDLESLARIEDAGYPVSKTESRKFGYRVHGLTTQLAAQKLVNNKHIPEEYLYGSIEQREALLAGLMDSDGSCGTNSQVEFSNTNVDIALGVFELCCSLGMIPKINWKMGTLNGKTYKKVYRILFVPDRIVFRLHRKVQRQLSRPGRGLQRHMRFIVGCKPIDSVPVRCISVDSPSHLYLAGNTLIPTHNSQVAGHRMTLKAFKPDTWNWIVGTSYRIGEKEFRVVWDDFNKLNILKYCKKAYSQHQGDMYIETPWHTNIQVVSADNQDSLVGEGLSHVIMSEAAKHNRSTWEQYIEPALSDHRGSADLPSTPQGFNWYHGMFMLGSEAASMHASMAKQLGLDQYRSFHFPTWENTFRYPGGYDDPEIQRVKNVVTENWFRQEYGAEFTATTGSIFTEWDESKHVLEHYEFDPRSPNYLTFDYGYANPFVALDIQITPSDEFIVWREYYVTQKSTPEHAQALLDRANPDEFRIDGMWGDPRGADEAATLSLMLGAHGWGAVQSFDVRWKPSIEQMQRLLMAKPPKLLISKNCPNLIRQMGKLHVKEQGKQAKFDLQEQAGDGNIQHKVDDHAVDALRYFIGPYTIGGASSNFSDLYGMTYKGSESDDFFTLRTRVGLGDDVFTVDRQF